MELSLSACSGVGNRTSIEEKIAIPGGVPGGAVTARIEPCITHEAFFANLQFCPQFCCMGVPRPFGHSIFSLLRSFELSPVCLADSNFPFVYGR